MLTHIYALVDCDGNVRYVGKTITKLSYRLGIHIYDAVHSRGDTHRSRWIRACLRKDYKPRIILLEDVVGDGWAQAEMRWIAHYRSTGARLTNHTDGGDGLPGYHHTTEARAKIGRASRGRKHSPEAIERTRQGSIGRKPTPDHLAKMRASWGKGSRHTTEARAKMSAALKGRPGPNLGRKFTAEHKAKISAAHKGLPGTNTGRRFSLEHRRKISEGKRRYHLIKSTSPQEE